MWLTAAPSRMAEVPRHQLTILERMGVPVEVAGGELMLPQADLIVDALIGYSLCGAPAEEAASLVRAANSHGTPVLALDVPSGVDTTDGVVHDPAIHAAATLTLALPKQGLASAAARECVGELYVADIGVPSELYARPPLHLSVGPIFAEEETVRLW